LLPPWRSASFFAFLLAIGPIGEHHTKVPPGTYSIGYSNSQYGAGVYSAPSSVSVGSGGTASVTAVYYAPTETTCSGSVSGENYVIYGNVLTADG